MNDNLTDLERQRINKLVEYKNKNINPFPNRFEKNINISDILLLFSNDENKEISSQNVQTAGRIMGKRSMGKAGFLELVDDSGKIQIYANDKTLDEADYFVFQNLDIGDIIGVAGELFVTKKGEKSIRSQKLTMLSKNLSPIPIVKEKDGKIFDAFADIETRYRKRYVDLIVNSSVRQDFKLRSKFIFEMRKFLQERDFIEVETPMLISIASGAAAKPFKTHHNALNMPLFLRIAPELHLKRLIVGGFEKVFEINRNFRNEGISTKHNPEFTMIEIYQAYADYNTMMILLENMLSHLAKIILGSLEIPYGDEIISLKTPWKKTTYLDSIKENTGLDFSPFLDQEIPSLTEAKKMAASIDLKVEKIKTFWEVIDEVFSQKVEPNLRQPIFITHYPKAMSPLSKNIPGNDFLVERFEPYIVGREIGNAFSELNDPLEQQERFMQQLSMKEEGAEEFMEMDEDFIEALKTGMPPTGGMGLGIDRMVMLFADKSSIKDVILFPLLRKG